MRGRTCTPQKWPKRGKSGSGDTIGIRVPSEDALRKIAFNVAGASGGEGGEQKERRGERERKMRKETRIQEGCDRDARCEKRERATANRDNRGNVAILLIENSSAPSQILIKSRKSLARSIGQTGKVRSVGRFALWQQSLAVRALYTRISTLRSRSCSVISTSV